MRRALHNGSPCADVLPAQAVVPGKGGVHTWHSLWWLSMFLIKSQRGYVQSRREQFAQCWKACLPYAQTFPYSHASSPCPQPLQ